jgi:hypothetical protein
MPIPPPSPSSHPYTLLSEGAEEKNLEVNITYPPSDSVREPSVGELELTNFVGTGPRNISLSEQEFIEDAALVNLQRDTPSSSPGQIFELLEIHLSQMRPYLPVEEGAPRIGNRPGPVDIDMGRLTPPLIIEVGQALAENPDRPACTLTRINNIVSGGACGAGLGLLFLHSMMSTAGAALACALFWGCYNPTCDPEEIEEEAPRLSSLNSRRMQR